MKKNFELGKSFHRKIRKYAQFLKVSDKDLMQILLIYGLNEYENNNENIKIMKIQSGISQKEEKKRIDREYYRDVTLQKDEAQESRLSDEMFDINKEISKLCVRCKINISEYNNEKLNEIHKEINDKSETVYTVSEIIYSLMHYSMKKELDYLEKQYVWKANLIDDTEYNAPMKVQMQLPKAIFNSLAESAEKFNISVSDYIKLILLDDFINTKKTEFKNIMNKSDNQ